MRILSLVLVLSALIDPAFAVAQGGFEQTFSAKARTVPESLQSLGYSHFGALELNSLINEASTVHARFSDRVAQMNDNCRLSAHWEVVNGVRTVYVNPQWWNKFPDQQTVLALHELLGEAGFIDDQYWISTSLWFLSLAEAQTALNQNNKTQVIEWISANAKLRLAKGTQMAGGVVGVGGGGEGASLFVKMSGLKRSLQEIAAGNRVEGLQDISHYLSSPLTVTYSSLCGRNK